MAPRSVRSVAILLIAGGAATGCTQGEVVEGFPDEFAGVGLELKIHEDWPVVVRPLKGGPSDLAGIKRNDRVVEINGRSTEGLSLGNVVMLLRGKPDSQATLSVMRKKQRFIFVVQRQRMTKKKGDYTAEK